MSTSIVIDDETEERAQRLADRRHTTRDALLREAIAHDLAREENRESFIAEAEESWRSYEESGRHLTGEEVRSWLRRWGPADEQKPPACHE